LIYDILTVPSRYDPYSPNIDTTVMVWPVASADNYAPRMMGNSIILHTPVYRYKTFELYGSELIIERIFVSFEQMNIHTLRTVDRHPVELYTLLIRQIMPTYQYVFRYIPSILDLRHIFGCNDYTKDICTSSRYVINNFSRQRGIVFSEEPWIDDYTVEGIWPPEQTIVEMQDVERHLEKQYVLDHIRAPIIMDDVTLQITSSPPCILSTQLVDSIHSSYGSRGYHLEVRLDEPNLHRGYDGTIQYYDKLAPNEFYQMITTLTYMPVRDIQFTINPRTTQFDLHYAVPIRGTRIDPSTFPYEHLISVIRTWILTSNYGSDVSVDITKSWTEEIFITVRDSKNSLNVCNHFYVDLGLFGLCTHTLTTR
jgi:hypothetical protein